MGYRNIVVDGTPYRWTAGRSTIAIRGENKGHWTFPVPDRKEDSDWAFEVTPSYVADLIRTEIEKRPAPPPRITKSLVIGNRPKPGPRPAVVGTAYCVFTDGGIDVRVLREVHLDAGMAKERATALGGFAEALPLHDVERH